MVRCPRCEGFIYSASAGSVNIDEKKVFKVMVKCINCGRHYKHKNGQLSEWPKRGIENVCS